MIMTISSSNRYPNSREYFYLKLLENGADELMSVERVSSILNLRPRAVVQALSHGELKMRLAISLDQLADALFRNPGFAPEFAEARQPLASLTLEQIQCVEVAAEKTLADYAYLELDKWAFIKAVSTALLRNTGDDWRQALPLIVKRIITKLSEE